MENKIYNSVFGNLTLQSDWVKDELFTFKLFDKNYEVLVSIVDNSVVDRINEKQESCYKKLTANKLGIFEEVSTLLSTYFSQLSAESISSALQFSGIYFSTNGTCVLSGTIDLDDDTLAEYDIGPDNEFGIEIMPQLELLPSNDDVVMKIYYE